jgi:hypothetical protein
MKASVFVGASVDGFIAWPNDDPLRHIATRHYPSGLVQSEYALTL